MASERLLKSSPPFPNGLSLAALSIISLVRLSQQSRLETEAMFNACRSAGFFLLDLRGDLIGDQMIGELDKIFPVIADTMHASEEDIETYHVDMPKVFWGYKRQGYMKTETGQEDRNKFFGVSQDDLFGNMPTPDAPMPIRAARDVLISYARHGQAVLSVILAGLERQLKLRPGILQSLHSTEQPSGTILRMISSLPSVEADQMRTSLLPHTDFGSVTLLANVLGGLQVLKTDLESASTNPEDWLWVKPQPGCLIVNMGDAMVEWTGGVLRSSLHRIHYSPGEQRYHERFSLAMLIRARQDAKMHRIVGGLIPTMQDDDIDGISFSSVGITGLTASEWEGKKAMMLAAGEEIAKSRGGRALKPCAR